LKIKGVDIVSIDPYHFKFDFEKGRDYVVFQVRDVLRLAGESRVQVWVQGFKVPGGREEEIGEMIRLIYDEGVRDIQFWSYGNESFSAIGCDDVEKVWGSLRKGYLGLRS